jgi:hypothetical protein
MIVCDPTKPKRQLIEELHKQIEDVCYAYAGVLECASVVGTLEFVKSDLMAHVREEHE